MRYQHPLRDHERRRLLAEFEALQHEADRKRAANGRVVKLTVMVGMILLVVLPQQYQLYAGLAVNFLWLWRT